MWSVSGGTEPRGQKLNGRIVIDNVEGCVLSTIASGATVKFAIHVVFELILSAMCWANPPRATHWLLLDC